MLFRALLSTAAALALTAPSSVDARAVRPIRRDGSVTQPVEVPAPKLNGVSQLFELDWVTPGASVVSVLGGDEGDFGGFCKFGELGFPER